MARSGSSVSELTADELAAGFPPRPALNLRLAGIASIDAALTAWLPPQAPG